MREVEMFVKRALMDHLPRPVYKRIAYPLWLRWYDRRRSSDVWQEGSYKLGDHARWRGVRLICCTEHYAGAQADHPWDPGWGWPAARASALWEPATARDRLVLRLVGDPRRTEAQERGTGPEGGA